MQMAAARSQKVSRKTFLGAMHAPIGPPFRLSTCRNQDVPFHHRTGLGRPWSAGPHRERKSLRPEDASSLIRALGVVAAEKVALAGVWRFLGLRYAGHFGVRYPRNREAPHDGLMVGRIAGCDIHVTRAIRFLAKRVWKKNCDVC